MPNHVYNTITVETDLRLEKLNKQKEIMHQIHDKGICRYFRPQPKALAYYTSPLKIVSESEYVEAVASACAPTNDSTSTGPKPVIFTPIPSAVSPSSI